MRVTIHIGTYKTATSAIQYGLARSDRAMAKVGAKYADTGLNVALSKHLHLFDRIVDGGYNRQRHLTHKGEDYIGGLIKEIEDPAVSHLLISEEELGFPSPVIAQYLAPLADVADVEIVMAVRRQPEFMESLYLQFLKEPLRGVVLTFPEFLESDYASYGDFFAVTEMWESVFGRDALTIVDFDDLRDGDVVTNFAQIVGLPRGLKSPNHDINPSVTPAAGELLRLIGASTPNFPRMALASMLRQLDPAPRTTLATPELSAEIRDKYRSSNQALEEAFGVNLDRDVSPSKRPISQAEVESAALEAAARVIGVMWKRGRGAANAIQRMSENQDAALKAVRGMLHGGDDVTS